MPSTWAISQGTPFEFDPTGWYTALAQIDTTHYLCAYTGDGDDGWATILQTAEEAVLDDLPLARLEPLQRIVQGQHLLGAKVHRVVAVAKGGLLPLPTPLGRLPTARVVHQDLPHGAGRDGQEVRAVGCGSGTAARKLEVRLVHQLGGAQRVARALQPQPAARHRPQLVVHQGQKPVESLALAGAGCRQQAGHLTDITGLSRLHA